METIMNSGIVTNAQDMLAKGTLSAYVSLGALGVVAILAVIGALKGFHRGVARQMVRVITIAASIAAAIYVAITVNAQAIAYFDNMTVSDAIATFGLTDRVHGLPAPIPDIISNLEMSALQSLLALPLGLVVSPIIFVLAFILVSAVLLIVHALISGILGFRHRKNNLITRLFGFVLGAAQGAVVGAVMLIPVIALCNIAGATVEEIGVPENDTETMIVDFYDENMRDLAESPIISITSKYGGTLLADKLATVTVGGEARDVRDTLPTAISLYSAISKLSGTDFTHIDATTKDNVHEIIEIMGEDKTVSSLMASVVSGLAHSLKDGDIPIESVEPFTTLINSIFEVLETSTVDTVEGDLTTITNVLFILSDAGVLSLDNAEAVDLLIEKDENGNTIVDKVVGEFNANDRTKGLVTQLTKVTISLMMNSTTENSGTEINIDEHYDEMKNGMNNIVTLKKDDFETPEEYHEAVVENLNTTLTESGIELEPEVVDSMATYIAENHGEKEQELSDEEFNDILLNYYDSYLEYQATGKLPPEFDQNGNGIPDTEENLGGEGDEATDDEGDEVTE